MAEERVEPKPIDLGEYKFGFHDDVEPVLSTGKGDEFRRHCLLNGLDNIGLTLQHEDKIAEYESKIPAFLR